MKKLMMIVTACAAVSGFAATWYVAPTGKKKNDGQSAAAPLKALWNAVEKAAPGDTILVAAGNYTGKMKCGWIEVDKPLTIQGGYSADFSARDVVRNATLIQPSNEMKATQALGMMTLKLRSPDGAPTGGELVIDGLVFDQGEAGSYHAVKSKPEGVATGMWMEPPAKGAAPNPSLVTYGIYAETQNRFNGTLAIRNCLFANCSQNAVNVTQFGGKVVVENCVFVANRLVACNVECSLNRPAALDFTFNNNTVLFTWTRTPEFTDMGYGLRANANVKLSASGNLFALNCFTGFDCTKGAQKTKKIAFDKNTFILNKKGDVSVTMSPNIKFLSAAKDEFEDLEEYEGIESIDGNVALSDPSPLKGKVNAAYLEGFLNATYTEQTSYDENSPANVFREAMGLNKVGRITSKVSMFFNKYPLADAYRLFGAVPACGAQVVK